MDVLDRSQNPASPSLQRLRILIVDDSPAFIDDATHFLRLIPQFEVIGTANSGTEAIVQAATLRPDLILMDIRMPGMNGLEAARQIKQGPMPPCIIMLTLHGNPEYERGATVFEADGFVAKSDFGEQLLPLIFKLCNLAPDA